MDWKIISTILLFTLTTGQAIELLKNRSGKGGEKIMRNSIKIGIIAICVMLIAFMMGFVGWTVGSQDHEKIRQTSENVAETTEETKEEMIRETTAAIAEKTTEEFTERITEESKQGPEEKTAEETIEETTEESTEEMQTRAEKKDKVVCIDPGHYKGASKLSGDQLYGYEEGVFTLKVALALRDELQKYGIQSYLTRETDSITIAGYTNGDLDHGKISLRGE